MSSNCYIFERRFAFQVGIQTWVALLVTRELPRARIGKIREATRRHADVVLIG